MSVQPSFPLPTLFTKNDARANQNDAGGNKLSVADSMVLLQSLKQSRSIWLNKAFLRFSTRSKEKADQVYPAPPPHSLTLVGSCDLEIGPHLFPQTKIFFVQYRYGQIPTSAGTAPPTAPAPTATQHTAPITVSHELHAKVLAAAAKDPELHHVLQLASQGRANPIQLRTLGTAIKAIEAGTYQSPAPTGAAPNPPANASTPIASTSHAPAQTGNPQSGPSTQPRPALPTPVPTPPTGPVSTATATTATHPPVVPAPPTPRQAPTSAPPPIPTTAVLLEFAERPIDRWLLPTEYVLLDRRSNGDVLLSTFYPFDAYVPAGGAMRSKPAHPITMRFVAASTEIWNALSRTCTTISQSSVPNILAEITNVPQRTYLQYRIAPGAMWEDIKMANPGVQSFLLPSAAPLTAVAATRSRRTDGTSKKRKAETGDNTGTSTPREPNKKGKGKEKEKDATQAEASAKPTGSAAVPQVPSIAPSTLHPIPRTATQPAQTRAPSGTATTTSAVPSASTHSSLAKPSGSGVSCPQPSRINTTGSSIGDGLVYPPTTSTSVPAKSSNLSGPVVSQTDAIESHRIAEPRAALQLAAHQGSKVLPTPTEQANPVLESRRAPEIEHTPVQDVQVTRPENCTESRPS